MRNDNCKVWIRKKEPGILLKLSKGRKLVMRGYCRFGGEFIDFWSILCFTGRINTAGYLWNLLVRRSYREFGSKKIRKILNSKKKWRGWIEKEPNELYKAFERREHFCRRKEFNFLPKGIEFFSCFSLLINGKVAAIQTVELFCGSVAAVKKLQFNDTWQM